MVKKKSISYLFPTFTIMLAVAILGFIFITFLTSKNVKKTQVLSGEPMPNLVYAKSIPVAVSNRNNFVTNILGQDYLASTSVTYFYVTDKKGNEVALDVSRQLNDIKWVVQEDWGHPYQNALISSKWKKDHVNLTILLLDDLDNAGIKGLEDNYGIKGLTPGQTLFVLHTVGK